jgi:hypothetical protein
LQPWFKTTPNSVLDKQSLLIVTIYGPYGSHTKTLQRIARLIRQKYNFKNTYIVKDRKDFRKRLLNETVVVYFTKKSYYYLQHSHVNIFIFYCGPHAESASMELQFTCQNLRRKIPCCAVMKDTQCNMATILEGQMRITKFRSDEFDSHTESCDNDITKLVAARCMEFLIEKYQLLP